MLTTMKTGGARLSRWSCALLLLLAGAPQASAQQTGFSTLILSPDPGAAVPQTTTMVSLSFVDPDRVLDVSTVRLLVDDADVTGEANVNGDLLVWLPQTALARGPHRIVVTMRARDGSDLPTVNWGFIVAQPPAGVTPGEIPETTGGGVPGWAMVQGNVVLEGAMNSVSGDGAIYQREAPATGRAWVNLRGRLGGSWRYNAYSHVNSYESRTLQPINRFRFNLRSKWLSVGVGDVTPRLHELILWGRRVRGWSVDLRTGPVNLSVVSGQSKRAVTGQLYGTDPTSVYRRGVFAQDLLAVRPSFGSGRTFQLGITVLKARDDVNSLTDLRTAADSTGATQSANVLPKDNLALGLDLNIRAFRGRLSLSYANAISLYNNDITGGPITKSELDSLLDEQGVEADLPAFLEDPDAFEDIFILNESMIPLDPTALTSMAQQARLTLQLGSHTLGARWRQVGGSYYSLGYSSLQRDRDGLRIQDTFRLFNDKLGVTVGWEKYSDNLDETKPATTSNQALTLDLFWQPDPQAPGFAFGYRDYSRQNDLSQGDVGAMEESTGTLSAGAFVPVQIVNGINTRVSFNFTNVGRDDARNPLTGTKNTYLLFGLSNRFENRPTDFSLTYGINTSELTGYPDATTTFNRAMLRARHAFTERIAGLGDVVVTTASSPAAAGNLGLDYSRFEATAGAEYYWATTSYASLRAGVISYTDNRRTGLDTSQFVVRLRLTQAF